MIYQNLNGGNCFEPPLEPTVYHKKTNLSAIKATCTCHALQAQSQTPLLPPLPTPFFPFHLCFRLVTFSESPNLTFRLHSELNFEV